MNRRRWLQLGCAQCAALAGAAAAQGVTPQWQAPQRFSKPDLSSDEGGLWAMMDREERRLRRSNFRLRDEAFQNYLSEMCCRLGGNHCPDVRAYAVRTPVFNANMAPNGMMQVWSGLLLRVENEAQLCAVLGHEIGHYLQRHSLERLRDLKDRAALAQFFGMFGLVGLIGQLATIAGMMSFSRDQERDADLIGLKLMRDAGYDTREAAKVWGNLIAELKANPEADPTKESALFASHPPPQDREATLAAATAGDSGQTHEARYRQQVAPFRVLLLEDELKRNRPRESVVLLSRLLASEPGNAALLHFRAEAYQARGEPEDANLALNDYMAALATSNELPQTYRSLGQLHRQRNEPQHAKAYLQRYLAAAPSAPDAELFKQQLEELK